jgi:3-oxoadipate enol-lactonase
MSELALLSAVEGPADAPVLVLGNSLGTSRAVWDGQVPVLRRQFRLLRYELPGHGGPDGTADGAAGGAARPSGGTGGTTGGATGGATGGTTGGAAGGWSPGPPGPYTVGQLGAGVLALLDAHGFDRVLYCGISLGGMIGMWLAANAPARIAGLAGCCTSAYLPPASGWSARAALVRSQGPAAVARQSVARWFPAAYLDRHPEAGESFTAMLAGIEAEGYAGCCEAIGSMDLRPALATIQAPTLVIAGEQDPATPAWHGALIASAVPGATLRVIRGAAHLASVSAAGEVTAALLPHLRHASELAGL